MSVACLYAGRRGVFPPLVWRVERGVALSLSRGYVCGSVYDADWRGRGPYRGWRIDAIISHPILPSCTDVSGGKGSIISTHIGDHNTLSAVRLHIALAFIFICVHLRAFTRLYSYLRSSPHALFSVSAG
ncbi:hypothetical protein K438DRAFT_1990282 [Mycena galopus ATCC 62051]|nr:hypothetical protein K438DRAFT_1990282 [Mycena galopus ATCC 62051]